MSAPPCILHDTTNDYIALFIFVATIVGYTGSVLWERFVVPPLFYADEVRKRREIALLEREAAELDTVDQLHLRGRAQRRILSLRGELSELCRRRLNFTISTVPPQSPSTHLTQTGQTSAQQPLYDVPSACISFLSPKVTCSLSTGLSLVRYNLPFLIKYTIRYGWLVLLLHHYGNRSRVVTLPTVMVTRNLPFWTYRACMSLLTIVMYGMLDASSGPTSTPSRDTAITATSTTLAGCTANSLSQSRAQCCTVLWWTFICVVALKFTVRVFAL